MTIYLVIITTALVLTQIIRLVQNTISLRKQNKLFDAQLNELGELEIKKDDFENQKRAYGLIIEYLEGKNEGN